MEFDVLSREKKFNKHLLCEASAGTGKTFTIEHLFLKSLLLPNMSVDKILVMTFTRSVARELVLRLKRALDQAIESLLSLEAMPDYLQAIVDQGKEREAKARLEAARDDIDGANIGTIHSFCFRALSESWHNDYKWAEASLIREFVEAFFRKSLSDTPISQAELQVLLQEYQHDIPKLLEKVQTHLWEEQTCPCRDIEEIYYDLKSLPKFGLDSAELERLSQSFKGLCTRQGELKPKLRETFSAYSKIFSPDFAQSDMQALIMFPLFASELFSEPKAKAGEIHSPVLKKARELEPWLLELGSLEAIMGRLVRHAKGYVQRRLNEQGLLCQEELLEQMDRALADESFVLKLQKKFKCVIVDEFQDTDPRQWTILQKLFLSRWDGALHFVGDPKQAIYHFRKADVYSYMQAKSLPDLTVVTLTTNYRSSRALVSALNVLFADKELFDLPKLESSFAAPKVSSFAKVDDLTTPNRGAIHFFIASGHIGKKRSWPTVEVEEGMFFPNIAREIQELKAQGISLRKIAILVKDRHQAESLTEYLRKSAIPTCLYRQKSVVGQPAFLFLQRLVKALLAPRDRARLVDLLSHPPFSYPEEKLFLLQETSKEALFFWAEQVTFLQELRKRFEEAGLASILKTALGPESREFWRDLESIVDMAFVSCKNVESLVALDEFLYRLTLLPEQEKEKLTCRFDPDAEAVQVLTLHASKGLEFEVVFALGLATRTPTASPEAAQELEAEKMRLFYVGCTRAKRRLYLPVAIDCDAKPAVFSTASPMELYLARENLEKLIESSSGTITLSHLEKIGPPNDSSEEMYTTSELEPLVLSKQKLIITSYTSLKENEPVEFKEQKELELPAGISTGLLFHKLLHNLFSMQAPPKEISEWLKLQLFATAFEGKESEVELLIMQTLKMSLGHFSLMDINWQRTFCEQEFYLQELNSNILRGAIDLVFEHEGKCYIVDWKTTLLESYDEVHLWREVRQKSYDLQAACYQKAMRAHLQGSQISFGGFFFIFVRGPAFLFLRPEDFENGH